MDLRSSTPAPSPTHARASARAHARANMQANAQALTALHPFGSDERRVIIVGYGEGGRELHRRATTSRSSPYRIVATCDGDGNSPLDTRIDALSGIDDLSAAIERHHAHEVWIALPLSDAAHLPEMVQRLSDTLVDIRWIPDLSGLTPLGQRSTELLGLPAIELNRPAIHGAGSLAKEVFDRLFAAAALVALSPLMLAIAIGIKCTSPGPVLFSQPRLGRDGCRFQVLKFRSMYLHAPGRDGELVQATRDDPRVTPLGRLLRRTSLDELPQFLNVLAGQMSVVGPRPHALPHNDLYRHKLSMYMQRHRVKPGITGWAQINGCRGETDSLDKMARRIELDLDYMRRWSFRLDLKIVAWTAWHGWTGDNAY